MAAAGKAGEGREAELLQELPWGVQGDSREPGTDAEVDDSGGRLAGPWLAVGAPSLKS
jgi:hypothetical protein